MEQAPLADSHVHLDGYPAHQVAAMLARADADGVRFLLNTGVDTATSRAGIALARRHSSIRAAIGIHPARVHASTDPRRVLTEIKELSRNPLAVSIGEIGLDAPTGERPPPGQVKVFELLLDLHVQTGLPINLHVVGAHDQALAILRARPRNVCDGRPSHVVAHYFVGGPRLAEAYLEAECLISVGRPVTRADQVGVRDSVRRVPLDRLLLETDTYPLPGRTTEPRDVASVCEAVAALKGLSRDDVARATTNNYRRVFLERDTNASQLP